MSSDLKAEATIELETSSLESSSDKVQKEFEGIGKSAVKGGEKAGKALDKTGEKAKKAATKLKETGTAGKKAGDDVAAGADKGSRSLDNLGTAADGADNSMETLSTSMIGLAQTATGVSDAIFGLSASLVGLEKTQFGIRGMEVAIERMERGLIVAYTEGILTTQELKDLTVDLGGAYAGLSLEVKQASADELALNGQMVTLAINTGAAIFQSVILIKTLTTMRGVRAAVTVTTAADSAAVVTNTGATAANTISKGANTGITATLTGVTLAAVAATRALTIAMLASPLAPFAIAAIGAGAAFVALNDDIGGVRSSIEDLTGSGRGSIPTLGFSITGLGDDVEDLGDAFDVGQIQSQEFADSIGGEGGFNDVINLATEGVQTFNTVLNPDGTNALSAFNDSLVETTDKLIPFANGIFDSSGNLIDLSKHMRNNNTVLDAWGKAILTSSDGLVTETSRLKANTSAIKENTIAVDENLKKNKDLARQLREVLKKARGQQRVFGGDDINEIRTFLAKSKNNFANPDFVSGGGSTAGGATSINRKTQQLEAKRQAVQTQQQQADELNAFFGVNLFHVQTFTANRGRTSLTPTPEGRQILAALGLDAGTAQLLKDARVNLDDFFGTDVSYPILGTTRRNVTIHNGRIVTRISNNVITGSRIVTSGGIGESRLAALSLAVAFAREKLAEKRASERIISEFRDDGGFGDISKVQGAVSFLSESFGLDSNFERSIGDRIRFLQRTQKELLLATTV